MNRYAKETAVGFFVLIGIVCLAYLTIRLGKMEVVGGSGYTLTASFNAVNGLKTGANIEISGVNVGRVSGIALEQENGPSRAKVQLRLKDGIKVTEYAIASVKTSGLIGDKYISIDPGGADKDLADGDEINDTESAVDIEALISKYVFGGVN